MLALNKIKYNDKIFQVFIDDGNRIIYEVRKDNKNNIVYLYPEINDLVSIIKRYYLIDDLCYDKYSNKKNELKEKFNKLLSINQKVIISGLIISLALLASPTIKYSIETNANLVNSCRILFNNVITSKNELKEQINTENITIDDVRDAIDDNNNLSDYSDLIHEFINDVYEKTPKQDWWIFYQNIKRMVINPDIEENLGANVSGCFDRKSSAVKYLYSLDYVSRKIVIRHELTHALNNIAIDIDDFSIKIGFNEKNLSYGYRSGEAFTSLLNSYYGDYNDIGYSNELFILDPLIKVLGINTVIDIINNYGINELIKVSKPYYKNISKYIMYFDTFFSYADTNEEQIKTDVDEDFLLTFNNMTVEFYLNLTSKLLNDNKISIDKYLSLRDNYKNNLMGLINDVYNRQSEEINKVDLIDFSYQNKLFLKLENDILNDDIKKEIRKNLIEKTKHFSIKFIKNKTDRILGFSIESKIEDNIPNSNYFNCYDPADYNFVIEQTNCGKRLRIVNKDDTILVDILTNEMLDKENELLAVIPMDEYMESIKNKDVFSNYVIENNEIYFEVKIDYFNIDEIVSYYNANTRGYSYNLKKVMIK